MDNSKSNKESAVIAIESNNSQAVAGETETEIGDSTVVQSQPRTEDAKETDEFTGRQVKRNRGSRQRMKRFRRKNVSYSVLPRSPSRYSSTPPSSAVGSGSEGSFYFDEDRLAEPIYRIARDRPSMEYSLTARDQSKKNTHEADLRAKLSQRQHRSKGHSSKQKLKKFMKQQKKILKKLSSGYISRNGITLNGNVYPNFAVSTHFNSVAQSSFAVHDGVLGQTKPTTHRIRAPDIMSRSMNAVSTAVNSSYLQSHLPVFNTEDSYSDTPSPSSITLKGSHPVPSHLPLAIYQPGTSAVALQNNLQYYNSGNFPNGMTCFQNSDINQNLNQLTSGSNSQVHHNSGLFLGNPYDYWYPARTQAESCFQNSSCEMNGTVSASNSGRTSTCNEGDWQVLSSMLPYVSDEAHAIEETERDEVEEIHIFDDEGDLLADCETADFIVQECDVGRPVRELPSNEDLGRIYNPSQEPEPEYECGRFPSVMQTRKKDIPPSLFCSKPQIPHLSNYQTVEDPLIYENGSSKETWTRRVEVVQGEMPACEETVGFSEHLPYTRIKNKALEVLCMLEDEDSPIEAIKAVCQYMKWEVPIFQIAILSRDNGSPAKYCCKITAGSQSFGPYKAEKTERIARFQAARKCMRNFKQEILQFLKGMK